MPPSLGEVDGALHAAVDAARSGTGRVVVVVGERGSGRSRVAAQIAQAAQASGMRVLAGGTGGVGVGVPFEVVAHLLGELAHVPPTDDLFAGAGAGAWPLLAGRAEVGSPEAGDRIIHSVAWLVRRLAVPAGLALVVDDLDVADEDSLRCLEYVATRSSGLPVLVAVTLTDRLHGRPAQIRATLSALPFATVVRPAPLTDEDVDALLADRGHPRSDPVFRAACLRLSGANAAMTVHLIDTLVARRVPPVAASLDALDAQPPPARAVQAVVTRLRRLGPQAAAVAEAVHVLGPDATPTRVTAVADVTYDELQLLLDRLRGASVIAVDEPLRLRSALVDRALAASSVTSRRAEMRGRAIEVLLDDGVPVRRLASRVHAAEAGAAAGGAEVLLAASRAELGAGQLEPCERHARRLVLEAPPGPVRTAARRLLLAVEVALDREGAADRYDAVLAGAAPVEAGALARELGEALVVAGRRRAAAEAFRRGATIVGGRGPAGLRTSLEALFVSAAREVPGLATEARDVLDRAGEQGPRGPGAGAWLTELALDRVYTGRPREVVLAAARTALAAVLQDRGPSRSAARCVAALLWCDEDAEADRAGRALAEAGAIDRAALSRLRAWSALRQGRLATALELVSGEDRRPDTTRAHGAAAAWIAVLAAMELGDLDRASASMDAAPVAGGETTGVDVHALAVLGWLELRRGDAAAAEAAFARAVDAAEAVAIGNPAVVGAWPGRAYALHRLGQDDAARATADEALRRAEAFGAPRPLAQALRAAAVVGASEGQGSALAERALAVLEPVGDGLDRAWALLTAGSLLCRKGDRVAGRARLVEAMDAAHRMGAADLERRATAELRAAGARPRRPRIRGAASLTPAERQVVEYARRGLSNREIAVVLYVTPKTVEWHLGNVFWKLGVRDRRDLAAALDEESAVAATGAGDPPVDASP